MKAEYTQVEMEVIRFEAADVITTSCPAYDENELPED